MRQAQTEVQFQTSGQGLTEVTGNIAHWLGKQEIDRGLLTVFCRHTSASLTIQENADPDVQRDLETFFNRLVAEDPNLYRHTMEGPDDMPAHVKASLMGSSVTVPVSNGRLALGTWQGIYLCEHRNRAGGRKLILTLQGAAE